MAGSDDRSRRLGAVGHLAPYQQNPLPPVNPAMRGFVTPWHRKQSVRITITVVTIVFMALCGLVMFLLLGSSFGPAVLTVAVIAAFIPVPILVFALLWLDRFEPEPWHYLAFTFGWGAFVATLAALIINTTGGALIGEGSDDSSNKITAIFIAPPTEEVAKAIPVFLLLVLMLIGRRAIHGVIDGIVYAGIAAIGFAFTENVLYFGGAYVEAADKGDGSDGVVALAATFVVRAVMSPFAHPLFTCMTGIGIGLAAVSRNTAVRVLAPIGGLGLAILLHGTWNFLASSGNFALLGVGYLFVMVPLFLGLVALAIWLRTKEAKLVTTMLPAYVNQGWLTHQELMSLHTMSTRSAARAAARSYGGPNAAKAVQEFQLAATKLALLRHSLLQGRADSDYARHESELLNLMVSRRYYVAQAYAAYTRYVSGGGHWGGGGYRGHSAGYTGPVQPGSWQWNYAGRHTRR